MREFLRKITPYAFIKAYRHILRQKERFIYRGNKVTCPICMSTFKSFAAYKPSKRKNSRCINCGSLERHRLQFLYLTEKTDLFKPNNNLKLLHFAPEKPLYSAIAKCGNIEYTKCDLSPRSPDFREISDVQKVDITNIAFDDNSFDVILCNHVLEHIEDDHAAMKELYRVLNKNGWGIFQVPIKHRSEKTYEDFSITGSRQRKKAFGQHNHVRIYGRDYTERLKNAGFTVVKDDYATSLSEADRIKYGINPREVIFLCKKMDRA
jgi:SAM-dependent methyltransferase